MDAATGSTEELIRRWRDGIGLGGVRDHLRDSLIERLLEERPRPVTNLFGSIEPLTLRFDWVPPSLKNTKRMEMRGHTMALVTVPEVNAAIERIRLEVGRAVRQRDRPLFGADKIRRDLVWLQDQDAVEVTWSSLGPDDRTGCGNRDLTNLAAVIDDAVASIMRGPRRARFREPGIVYEDDRQIAHATDVRVRGRKGD